MKPHICKVPGFAKIWYVFYSLEHRDRVLKRLRDGTVREPPDRWGDPITWGITFEHALRRYLGMT